MNRERRQATALFVIAFAFLVLAFARPQGRGVWLALAVIWVLIGVLRLRRRQPPSGTPGA
jgi:hypothetical protein